MGLAFPVALLLTAVAWLLVSCGIVVSWLRTAKSRYWRILLVVTVTLSAPPFVLASFGIFDSDNPRIPAALLVASVVGPLVAWYELKRAISRV